MIYNTYDHYRRAWDEADIIDPPVPLNIDLEIASICNLRCPMCFIPDPSFEDFISQKSEDGKPLRRIMSTEMAFKIIDEAAKIGVPALKIQLAWGIYHCSKLFKDCQLCTRTRE